MRKGGGREGSVRSHRPIAALIPGDVPGFCCLSHGEGISRKADIIKKSKRHPYPEHPCSFNAAIICDFFRFVNSAEGNFIGFLITLWHCTNATEQKREFVVMSYI